MAKSAYKESIANRFHYRVDTYKGNPVGILPRGFTKGFLPKFIDSKYSNKSTYQSIYKAIISKKVQSRAGWN